MIKLPARQGVQIPQDSLLKKEEKFKSWGTIIKNSSRCGLGKTATNSLVFAMDKFKDYFNNKLDKDFNGLNFKFDMEAALEDYEKFNSP